MDMRASALFNSAAGCIPESRSADQRPNAGVGIYNVLDERPGPRRSVTRCIFSESQIMKIFVVFIAFLTLLATARADRDTARIGPRAIASSDGSHFLLVKPVSERLGSWIWTVYAMGKDGAFKELWSRDGRYARDMFLSDDGRYVACIESWPEGRSPNSDVVIAVFEEGRFMKGYGPSDILRDLKSVQYSVNHYLWVVSWPPIFGNRNAVYFTTIERVRYRLDLRTGRIEPSLMDADLER